jgi:hypothetical protein
MHFPNQSSNNKINLLVSSTRLNYSTLSSFFDNSCYIMSQILKLHFVFCLRSLIVESLWGGAVRRSVGNWFNGRKIKKKYKDDIQNLSEDSNSQTIIL